MDIDKTPAPEPKPSRYDPSVHDYVRQVADLLHLKDWRIVLDEENVTDKNHMGEIWPVYGRKVAYINLNHADWPRYTKVQKRHTITHELLHCHAEPLADFVRDGVAAELGQSALNMFKFGFKQHLEYCIDAMTDIIAATMPEYPD